MPLTGNKEQDFHEFRHGKTFKRTAKKYGKKKANKQMVAVVMSEQRKHGKHPRKRTRR